MTLSGWKEIARYLGCGVRTAQRWGRAGLPVRRPIPGRRAHVVASSDDVDSWIRESPLWRDKDRDILGSVKRARELRIQVQQAREDLHLKMKALRKEVAALRAKWRLK